MNTAQTTTWEDILEATREVLENEVQYWGTNDVIDGWTELDLLMHVWDDDAWATRAHVDPSQHRAYHTFVSEVEKIEGDRSDVRDFVGDLLTEIGQR